MRRPPFSGATPAAKTLPALLAALTAALTLSLAFTAPPASAAGPWWHLTSGSRPSYLPSEGEGVIVLTIENFGDAPAGGPKSHVTITDTLPEGLEVIKGTGALLGSRPNSANTSAPLNCTTATLTCVLEETLAPYQQLEVRIKVKVLEGAHTGELNHVSVSGGGAPSASLSRAITVSEKETPFGVEDFELRAEEEGGALSTHAGSHPFQVTGTLIFNQGEEQRPSPEAQIVFPAALPKDIDALLPPGLIGDPTPLPTCSTAQFAHMSILGANPEENDCPASTAVGVAAVTVMEPLVGYVNISVPVFNLQPAFGEPARFGFAIPIAKTTITLDTALRSGPGEDYGITVSSLNTTEQAGTLEAQVSFWGVPGDARHNSSRGWSCLTESEGFSHGLCVPSEDPHPPAFLSMPTSCEGPLQASAQVSSWLTPGHLQSFLAPEPLQSLDSCNQLAFNPSVSAQPSTDRASAPSGLDFNLDFHDEGLTSAEGSAQSHMKDITVTLPEGLTANPSVAVGLLGCRPGEYARESISSKPGEGCPNSSKLGTVEVTTPLLPVAIHGSLYIAQPYENPFGSLLSLYVVLKNPEKGILIKLAGKVTPDPVTGRLTTTFKDNPPVAFDHFNFHFREGQQAPLISPPACGSYTTEAQLTPFSEPASALTELSSFQITKGFDGGPCPAGVPFAPQLQAGTINNNAAGFSPFYLHLTRSDADAEISAFSTNLPPGLEGILTGIPFCPEADIAAARSKSGAVELASPSCPQSSLLGHSLVGTGVGAVLAYTPGKIYLAGPYNGDPFSLLSVTSAVVGPFDLGTVVIRFGLSIDPHTAQVSVDPTASEPIPTILQGIVTHVRDIRVYIDRPNFTLNPTSCDPTAISSTLKSNLNQSTTISSRFQATNCQGLKFAPKFSAQSSAKTSKANGASLTTKLAYPPNSLGSYANIAKVKVELPKQLPSRLTTLQKACTSAQFDANPAGCPPASFIGHATVHTPLLPVPVTGPAIFVSHGNEAFPSLVMVLQGYGVTVDLVGTTLIRGGVTSTTFKTVPDTPFSDFELTLPQGPYSALAANADLCAKKLTMPAEFIAQNGAIFKQNTPISVSGCKKKPNRKELLAKALKACHKKHPGKRAACERQARTRYGAHKQKKRKR
jgi:uncharacterized repeat protein (TIGR01451 family)